jgi:7-keto-8-aminopelargonate synthetase-like enzyme
VAGDEDVIHYIKHFARSFIFSASITASNTAAALEALRIMRTEQERFDRLTDIAARMRGAFLQLGFNIGETETPIIPVAIGEKMTTFMLWRALFDGGVFVNTVVPPAVAPRCSGLRTSYMATHTDEQLDQIISVFEQVRNEVLIP